MQIGERQETIACDWLAAATGLVPRTQLAQLLGCALHGEAIAVDNHQATTVPEVFAAGECCGVKGDLGARLDGTIAGIAAAGAAVPARMLRRRDAAREFGALLGRTFAPRRELLERIEADTIVCRCEDVVRSAIDPAWSARQAKLWTRVAMGACQGAVCGTACQALFGWDTNAARPPLEQPPLMAWAAAVSRRQVANQATDPPPAPDA
jgi:NADPH-dependent 2,4-dienoyl-CoA reductase/sulfur reductase-like enzyme